MTSIVADLGQIAIEFDHYVKETENYISTLQAEITDTDSVVLGHPLPKDMISNSVLGMFKLEDIIRKGYFLAPKSYCYIPIEGGKTVLKYKGPAKDTDLSLKFAQEQSKVEEAWSEMTALKSAVGGNKTILQPYKAGMADRHEAGNLSREKAADKARKDTEAKIKAWDEGRRRERE